MGLHGEITSYTATNEARIRHHRLNRGGFRKTDLTPSTSMYVTTWGRGGSFTRGKRGYATMPDMAPYPLRMALEKFWAPVP